ncbi:MAG: hypothetical protein GH143_01475 [Calditrichaeota bacterium]|nr:hypothetical protein [Calditrichota bacterium]
MVSYLDSNIAVDGDFFVVMMYDGSNYPSFGYDLADNDRAYDWDGENLIEWNETYFMRAIVEVPGSLLKEVGPSELVAFPGEKPTLDPALLAPLLPRVDIPAKGTKVKTDR